MRNTRLLGNIAEKKAVRYLKKNGLKIIERNFTTVIGEIDIIARQKDYIVFIEVKYRKSNEFGVPSQAVNRSKQSKYRLISQQYLLSRKLIDNAMRFDVIEISDKEINHIINAF